MVDALDKHGQPFAALPGCRSGTLRSRTVSRRIRA